VVCIGGDIALNLSQSLSRLENVTQERSILVGRRVSFQPAAAKAGCRSGPRNDADFDEVRGVGLKDFSEVLKNSTVGAGNGHDLLDAPVGQAIVELRRDFGYRILHHFTPSDELLSPCQFSLVLSLVASLMSNLVGVSLTQISFADFPYIIDIFYLFIFDAHRWHNYPNTPQIRRMYLRVQ
jgi:hypothetical protein